LAANFKRNFPSGYFLINWRVTSPKLRASGTQETGFIPDLAAPEGRARKRRPAISTLR
jgi:hypothetical protein